MRLRPVLLFLLAALIGSAAGSGQTAVPTEKQRLAALSEEDRKWLEYFVAPIILPKERKEFLALTQPYEREAFKLAFWKRRSSDNLPPPLGPGYEQRYEELRALAESTYDRWPNDAAAMVLRYGEPADIKTIDCPDVFRPGLEIWTYASASPGGHPRRYFFYRRLELEPRRMWIIGTPDTDVFQPNACQKGFPGLASECTPGTWPSACPLCGDACEVYKVFLELRASQGSPAGSQIERSKMFEPVDVPLEGVESIRTASASASNPGAKPIGVEGPSAAPSSQAPAPAATPTPAPIAAPPATAAAPAAAVAAPTPGVAPAAAKQSPRSRSPRSSRSRRSPRTTASGSTSSRRSSCPRRRRSTCR